MLGINPPLTLTERVETLLKARAFEELDDPNRWREFLKPSQMLFGRVISPHEVGDIAAILCSEKTQYLSGTVIDIDGGAKRTK